MKLVAFDKHGGGGSVHVDPETVHRVEDADNQGDPFTKIHTHHGVVHVAGSSHDTVKKLHGKETAAKPADAGAKDSKKD